MWISRAAGLIATFGWLALTTAADAAEFTVTVHGSDAIFLAGRTDLAIPPANQPWSAGMRRHPSSTPEEIRETYPPTIPVAAGQVVRVVRPAAGGINFFNGTGAPWFRPDGNGASGSSRVNAFGGISGYIGTQGALVGVFLGPGVPKSGAPLAVNSGVDFTTLSPRLQQVFFIGDGKTRAGALQQFVAPPGATRLALGLADGWSFVGAPGAYDDNDGSYSIRLATGK
jgi:hypothetical protein